MQREAETIGRMRSALAYPAFILVLASFAVFILISFVLPSLTSLLSQFRTDLPAPTKFVVGVVSFGQTYGVVIGIGIAALVAAAVVALQTGRGQYAKDLLLLRIPVVGEVVRKSNLARFARTMAVLVGSGVRIVETLDLTIRTSQNLVLRRALEQLRTEVIGGRSIFEALGRSRVFPPVVAQMVRVGEETGTLETSLASLATLYDEDTDRAISRLIGMIEPTLIIVVGLVAVSIISPIYSMMSQVR